MHTIVDHKFARNWPLLLLAAAFIWLYLPAFNEFIYDWSTDDNYSHGFLIPAISLFLLWQKKKEIQAVRKETNAWGLGVVVLGLLLTVVGTAAAEWFSVRFSLIVVVLGLVLYLGGKELLRLVWFPAALWVFAIPIPYTIFRTLTFPLQLFSTRLTSEILATAGVPVLRQGNILHLPGYSLEVVEACSGLRSILTLSTLAAVFSHMSTGGVVYKSSLVAMAVPIAIAANIFRLLVTSFGALLISAGFAEGFLHDFSGLVVFLVGLALFFLTSILFKWIGQKRNSGLSLASSP